MSASESTQSERTALWASPGLIVAALFSLLVLMIAIGVVVTNRGGSEPSEVTIAELRAHPERYDGQTVILTGAAEDVRQLPVLDQYALYTFRDETGSMWVLSQRGVPPSRTLPMFVEGVQLTAVYHSRITLDEQIQALIEAQFGSLAGTIAGSLLPGLAINAVFLEHVEYDLIDSR